jgi:hypothetical protein
LHYTYHVQLAVAGEGVRGEVSTGEVEHENESCAGTRIGGVRVRVCVGVDGAEVGEEVICVGGGVRAGGVGCA